MRAHFLLDFYVQIKLERYKGHYTLFFQPRTTTTTNVNIN